MDDLDASREATQLPEASRRRIVVAAMTLSDVVNHYDRTWDLHWESLVQNAYEIVAVKRASGEVVPDITANEKYIKFIIGIMIDLSDKLIDSRMQQFATDITNLSGLDRNVHATQIVKRLEKALLANDKEAKRIWPLLLNQHTSREIDKICRFQPGTADTIKKRICRRAETFLRSLLYLKEG